MCEDLRGEYSWTDTHMYLWLLPKERRYGKSSKSPPGEYEKRYGARGNVIMHAMHNSRGNALLRDSFVYLIGKAVFG